MLINSKKEIFTCSVRYAKFTAVEGHIRGEPDVDWVGSQVVNWSSGNHATQNIQDIQSVISCERMSKNLKNLPVDKNMILWGIWFM